MTSAAPARPARGLERTRGGGRYARGQVLRVDGGARGRYRHPPREDRSPRRRGSGSGPPATPPRAAGRRRAAGGGRRGRVVGAVAGGARHAGPVPGRAGGVGTGLAPGRLPHGLRRGLAPRHVRVHPVGTGRLGLGIRAETGGALYSVPGGQPGHAPSRVKGVDDPGQRMLGEPAAPVRPGGIGTETRRAPARPAPTDVSMAVAGTAGRRRGLAGADWLARTGWRGLAGADWLARTGWRGLASPAGPARDRAADDPARRGDLDAQRPLTPVQRRSRRLP
jgi:hypothetical protein